MAKNRRIKRLDEIANYLSEMANACALDDDDVGNAGTFLHEAVNNIWTAQKCLHGEDIPIPIDFLFRSMGIDTKQKMKDVADISSMAGEADED